jgi:hypothetical protein
MSHLKSLTLTISPQQVARNPKLIRRQKMVSRLEEQLKLANDPAFAPIVRRWKKTIAGPKVPVEIHKRVRPWWRSDGNGSLVLILRNGLKALELEKGKAAIVVGAQEQLAGVLETLIAAAKAGELDAALEAAGDAGGRGIPKRKAA